MPQERGRHGAPDRRRRRWNRGDLAILLCGVLAFVSFTFGAPLFQQEQRPAGRNEAVVAGPPTTTAPTATPVATTGTGAAEAPAAGPPAASLLPPAAEPRRIRYPAAAFDVPVHPLELDGSAEASQTIVPPETMDGYWLTPFGVPGEGSANTTYVIGHSWEGADAPFNQLSSAAVVGDVLDVDTATGTIPYRVESITTYLKSSLKDSPIWDIVPNRLVLVSCFTEDPWGKNVVISAVPAVP